ncbi:MAG: hypothetical protein NC092_00895 [Butyrivibrio sp.]|nr:hypothetical protein [Muribaculum sp.]MCM1551229.1 hypothetical protein [Butyrivibrio sp.]
MDRGVQKGREYLRGGILSLAGFVHEHQGAIEYDLLTKTGYTLNDVGRTLPWSALQSFITHKSPDSALCRELAPELADWCSIAKTNALLADIYDMLAIFNTNVKTLMTKRTYPRPKFQIRPVTNRRNADDGERHFGRDPLPPDELDKWFERKRRERGERNG